MIYCLAGFMAPVYIGTTPKAFLLALPLIAVISFIRETSLLFGSILAFMVLAAIGIFIFMKLTVG